MIYLDNASTTKPAKEAIDAIIKTASEFGNPSSMHRLGITAEKNIKQAKSSIATKFGVQDKQIYFTSGGTESNNLAILGVAHQNQKRGKKIITTKIEHPSVLMPCKQLELEGFEVVYLDVTPDGIVDINQLENELTDKTILVSIMHVNNEIGMIQPIDKVKSLLQKYASNAYFHVDAVQSFGKLPIKIKNLGIDLLTVSAHKIHGVKGCGALFIGDGVNLAPCIYGGGQQQNIRPGTENVPGIAAFGAVTQMLNVDNVNRHLLSIRSHMKRRLESEIDNILFNGNDDYASGSVLNVSFIGYKAEILLHSLEMKDVFVSTGSACSTNKPMPSHVLSAMGRNAKEIEGAVRFSFSKDTTMHEIDKAVEIIKQTVLEIRKYTR